MPTRKWTPDEARAHGARGRAALKAKWENLRKATATLHQVRRTKSPLQAIDVILAGFYRDLAKLCSHSSAAERLSRTIFNLEQIRRIHTKGTKGNDTPPAVAQSGPLGIAEQEPLPANPSPVPDATPETDSDSSLPEMSPDL